VQGAVDARRGEDGVLIGEPAEPMVR